MSPESGERPSANEQNNELILKDGLAETVGGAAVGAASSETGTLQTATTVENVYANPAQVGAAQEKLAAEAKEAARIESERILNEETFKLGELNPLINPTDLSRRESVDAVRHTVMEKIRACEGMKPKILESAMVMDIDSGNTEPRFIARFEVPTLTPEQMVMLEELVRETYGESARTRKDSKGNKVPTQNYPPTQIGEEMKLKTGGWYMGPAPYPTSGLQTGLFVFKDFGPITEDNFLDDSETPLRYIIEVREATQYQTDLVAFVTQVSAILSQEKKLDRGQLLYETYYDLMRLGLKKTDAESIYGMDEATDMIKRELIIPLANPEISEGINQEAQSVLMVGVPGTGKTLIVERLLQEESGIFILPMDPFELQKEVILPPEKQTLLPRIAQIANITGKRVVLHIDDIENMVKPDEVTNSAMLNLMAGIKKSGFYIIASTNYPEKINPSLIQPQRFSVLIHCGLQNEDARYEILKIHADAESKKEKQPLFASEEIRDIILRVVASHTDAFTPRYLADITNVAKSFLIKRVAETRGKAIGLTEEDLDGEMFSLEDWDKALHEVSQKYDSKRTKEDDRAMANFVKKHSMGGTGFTSENVGPQRLFQTDVYEQFDAAQTAARAQNS